eukprot:jgi/Undpi1/12838/HiC_scaffold_7.g02505.m1
MTVALLRRGSANSRDIKFEIEAALVVYEEEKAAMTKLRSSGELTAAAKRAWEDLQQEMIALEGLYMQATGVEFNPPQPVCEREMKALEAFFMAMHGHRWLDKAGWLGRKGTANTRGVPPFTCNPWCWVGVECGVGDVQGLSLSMNQLQGRLPGVALRDMRGLVNLDLSYNEIEGTLPLELGALVHMQYLRLAATKLEGPIPDTLGQIKGLRKLDFSFGGLSGPIPASLGCCKKLDTLNLSHNQLGGTIPVELGDLGLLNELYLAHNRIEGAIPPSLGGLVRLRVLSLSCNELVGPLTPWLVSLTRLKRLLLDHNEISGCIPRSMENFRDLQVLHLQSNKLTGVIPRELGTLGGLKVINLSRNRLRGKLPSELGDVTDLAGLELGHNLLTGPLPAELGRLSRLVDLNVVKGCPSHSLPLRRGFTRNAAAVVSKNRRDKKKNQKRFRADAAITDNMVQPQRKEEGEKKGTSRTGKVDGRRGKDGEEVQRLWGMLYADDAGIVSRSSEGPERMMTVIVSACSRRSG